MDAAPTEVDLRDHLKRKYWKEGTVQADLKRNAFVAQGLSQQMPIFHNISSIPTQTSLWPESNDLFCFNYHFVFPILILLPPVLARVNVDGSDRPCEPVNATILRKVIP